MRHARALTVAILTLQAGLPASGAPPGQEPRTTVPVFHQLVSFSLPSPFTVAFEKTTNSVYVREHVPAGENSDEWTRMITLSGVQGLASNPQATLQGYLQALARGFQRHCPDTYVALELGPQPIVAQPSFAAIASCGHVGSAGKGRSETSVMLAIKGNEDFYTLQWTERGPDSSRPLKLDGGYWSSRLARLAPVKLCTIVPGEPPPYASCAGG
jgi:hypothetical protein